jgi:hypothetical protein
MDHPSKAQVKERSGRYFLSACIAGYVEYDYRRPGEGDARVVHLVVFGSHGMAHNNNISSTVGAISLPTDTHRFGIAPGFFTSKFHCPTY